MQPMMMSFVGRIRPPPSRVPAGGRAWRSPWAGAFRLSSAAEPPSARRRLALKVFGVARPGGGGGGPDPGSPDLLASIATGLATVAEEVAQTHSASVSGDFAVIDFDQAEHRPANFWRSAVHCLNAVGVLALTAVVFTSPASRVAITAAITFVTWFWEVGRKYSATFDGAAMALFGLMGLQDLFHPEEKRKVTSWTWYMTSLLFLAVAVPYPAAVASIAVLGVGDPAAGAVGRRWGRVKIPGAGGKKSLEGSLAFLAAGLAAALAALQVCCPGAVAYGGAAGAAAPLAVAGAATGAGCLGELFNGPVDDNLAVPLAAGGAAAVAMALLGL